MLLPGETWQVVVRDRDGNELQRNDVIFHENGEAEMVIEHLPDGAYVYALEIIGPAGRFTTAHAPITVSGGDEDGVDGSGTAEADA